MSLSKISTELDATIVRYLASDIAALKALCGTSQHYRSVAAPRLYESIEIEGRIEDRLPCLLLALIDNPELAGYIKSFTMFHDEDTPDEIAVYNVQHIARKLREPQSHIAMSILRNNQKHFDDALERVDHLEPMHFEIDAIVALILDMADNVETVRLDVTSEQLNNKSYLVSWVEYAFHMSKPHTKLKSIEIHKSGNDYERHGPELDFFLYASAQRISLREGHIDYLNPKFPNQWPLCTLELSDIAINLSVLEDILSTKAFSNLSNLVLDQLQDNMDHWWFEYDFQRLSDVLGVHLSSLQTFTCTNLGHGLSDRCRFRSFRNLSQLQRLRIDWNMLIDQNFRAKEDYEAMVPQHLQNLELVNFRHRGFETWSQAKYSKWLCGLDHPDNTDVYMHAWKFITASSWSTPSLETLTLEINAPASHDSGVWLIRKKTLIELQAAQISAAACGVSFRVFENVQSLTETRDMLDGPATGEGINAVMSGCAT